MQPTSGSLGDETLRIVRTLKRLRVIIVYRVSSIKEEKEALINIKKIQK